MAEETSKYTHVGVLKRTQKQIAILSNVANGGEGVEMYKLVDAWAQTAWQEAKDAGLVNDAMLPPALADEKRAPSTKIKTIRKIRTVASEVLR